MSEGKQDDGRLASPPGLRPSGAEPQASQAKPLVPDASWVILADHNYAIRFWRQYSHALTFKVFSACEGWRSDEPSDRPGTWELFDGNESWPLGQWEDAFWEIGGDLKWDGCINWQTNEECMVHGCSPRHAEQIAAIFQTVYHIGKRHFDLLGDEVPPLPDGAFEVLDAIVIEARQGGNGEAGAVHESAGPTAIAQPLPEKRP